MKSAQFFARFFGFTYIPVEGESEFYYFEQEVDACGTKNTIQARKFQIDRFYTAVGSSGPFITGISGAIEDGFPDHLIVCPSLGADVVSMYHRDGLAG